jgi:hypothetical protein
MYEYRAIVKSVIDASTIEATLDLGFGITVKKVFRIKDTPLSSEEDIEYKEKAIGILKGRRVVIIPTKIGRHGRYEAEIYFPDEDKDYIDCLK